MDKNVVQSVERTFAIIDALSKYPKGAFLNEIANASALNKTTAHRLINSLVTLGYANQDIGTGKYYLTLKMFEIGSSVFRNNDILSQAKPYLEKLSRILGEAVHLVVRDGVDVVYVYKEDSGDNTVRMSSRVGMRIPMYCTAVGKSILAELPEAEVNEIWGKSDVKRRTDRTITTLEELKNQLAEIRSKGYAVDNEENEKGVYCVGASICNHTGEIFGAFSVSVPISRMDVKRIEDIAELVLQIKQEIRLRTGK